MNNPTTGTVTVYYDTDSTYKNGINYGVDYAVEVSPEGLEGRVIRTAGLKNAPILVTSPDGNKTFHQTFRIESQLKNGKVTEVNFKVAKSALSSNGITKNDVILYHGYIDTNKKGEWIPLDTYLTGEDKVNQYYKAYTNGTSPFAVVFMENMPIVDEEHQRPIPVVTDEPTTKPTAEPVKTAAPVQTATPAAKTPLALGGVIAGLAAAVLAGIGRRE